MLYDSTANIGPLVIGGAGFSYQLNPDPETAPIVSILESAFDAGVTAIDTSPYYEPSEQLLGAALNHPTIKAKYSRDEYSILTKVGRITEKHLDYSPDWIRKSVARSLTRFQTSYLDIVFAHDVELVTIDEAVTAVGVLFDLAKSGCIRHVGISGYSIDVLWTVAKLSRQRFGRSIDAIQTWAQLTLQNSQLETHGFAKFREVGVRRVFCSSPLAVGLLRAGSVPVGRLGDWHPAPIALREQARKAADMVAQHNDNLASLALRYAMRKAQEHSTPEMLVSTIVGVSDLSQLMDNIETAKKALGRQSLNGQRLTKNRDPGGSEIMMHDSSSNEVEERDKLLCLEVRKILGNWIDYDFSTETVPEVQTPKEIVLGKITEKSTAIQVVTCPITA